MAHRCLDGEILGGFIRLSHLPGDLAHSSSLPTDYLTCQGKSEGLFKIGVDLEENSSKYLLLTQIV